MGVAIGDYDNDGLDDVFIPPLAGTVCFIMKAQANFGKLPRKPESAAQATIGAPVLLGLTTITTASWISTSAITSAGLLKWTAATVRRKNDAPTGSRSISRGPFPALSQ